MLPEDRYSPEYREVVKLLGGSKTWSGAPKKLKVGEEIRRKAPTANMSQVDAQNHALAACIADDALKWIYSPNVPMAEDDEYDSDGDSIREVVKNPDVIEMEDSESSLSGHSMLDEAIFGKLGKVGHRPTRHPSSFSRLSSYSPPPASRAKVPQQSSNYLQQSSVFQKTAQQAPPAVRGPRNGQFFIVVDSEEVN